MGTLAEISSRAVARHRETGSKRPELADTHAWSMPFHPRAIGIHGPMKVARALR